MSTTYNLTFGQLTKALNDYTSSGTAALAHQAALGLGNEAFLGTSTTDIFNGSAFTSVGGADLPQFNNGAVTINNTAGNTFISEAPSNSTVTIGDRGFDLIVAGNQTSGVTLNVYNNSLTGLIDTIVGGSVADGIAAQTGNNLILAGSGHEFVWTGSGNDTIYGGGNTNVTGSNATGANATGSILFYGADSASSHDTVNGSAAGGDTVQFLRGDNLFEGAGTKADWVYTGQGMDTIDLGNTSGIDYVYGTQQASFGSTIYGGSGQDHVQLFTGNNDVFGGSGTDTVYLGAGADSFKGGSGSDTVHLGTTGAGVTQTIVGGASTQVLTNDSFASSQATVVGGVSYTEVTMGSGQTVDLKNVTIQFSNGSHTIS